MLTCLLTHKSHHHTRKGGTKATLPVGGPPGAYNLEMLADQEDPGVWGVPLCWSC